MPLCNVSMPGITDSDSTLPSLPYKTLICLVNSRRGGKVVAGVVIKTDLSHGAPEFGDLVKEIVRQTPELNCHDGMGIVFIPLPEDDEMAPTVDSTCA
jgi:hypothetical protein